MNETSRFTFEITNVIKGVRDTLLFILPNELNVNFYENTKKVCQSPIDENMLVGKIIKSNEDKLAEFIKRYKEFMDDVYGENSTILTKTSEGNIRVDHTQNITILKHVIFLSETLRDILAANIQQGMAKKEFEAPFVKYLDFEERFDRAVKFFLVIREYEKSFGEFQKVMSESKGQPTPQSNYIIQNELNILANAIRLLRDHCRMTDNATLDKYDDVVELLQMCEGRRERRDGKPFPELFKSVVTPLGELVNSLDKAYQENYQIFLKEIIAFINKAKEEAKEDNKA